MAPKRRIVKRKPSKSKNSARGAKKNDASKIVKITMAALLWGNLPVATSASEEVIDPLNTLPNLDNNLKEPVNEYIPSEHPAIHARSVLNTVKLCYLKEDGISKGRNCKIGNDHYYMKFATPDENYRFQEVYNLLLLKNLLDVEVPRFGYLQDSRLYFATLALTDFVSANTLRKHFNFYDTTVRYIGQNGIAKLAVAKSLVADLIKMDNWGCTPAKGLVILDADGGLDDKGKSMMPTTVAGYLRMAAKAMQTKTSATELGLPLSRNNIIEMKEIYQSMLTKKLPDVDASVNLNPKLFKEVLQKYISACDGVLNSMAADVDPAKPMENNNISLKQSLEVLADEIPMLEVSQAQTPGFFKTIPKKTVVIEKIVSNKLVETVQAALATGTIALVKQLSSTGTIQEPTLPAPSTITNLQLWQKTGAEMHELITPMVVVGAGVGIAAAAFIYTAWKKFRGKGIQPFIISNPNQSDKVPDITIDIRTQPKPAKSKR